MTSLAEALATGRGVERPFNCPAHSARSDTASVNVLKGVWFCYSCGANGTLDGHIPTVDDAINVLAGTTPPRVLPETWLDLFDADHTSPYWTGRLGYDTAHAFRCGTDPYSGAPTYPIRDEQRRLIGVVTRHEGADWKYRYPYNVATSRTLFGNLRPCDVLVLVEGAPDVMAIEADGLPGNWVTAGTFGAGIHAPQLALVAWMNPRLIISAFDDDDAGHKATARSEPMLTEIAPVLSHRWSTLGVKDAGDAPPGTRIASLHTTATKRVPA